MDKDMAEQMKPETVVFLDMKVEEEIAICRLTLRHLVLMIRPIAELQM